MHHTQLLVLLFLLVGVLGNNAWLFPNSTLLPSTASRLHLNNWVNVQEQSRYNTTTLWTLCWKGSLHGFLSSTFHARCDWLGPTLTVVQSNSTYGSHVFGGFAGTSWFPAVTGYIQDSISFIYTFRNSPQYYPVSPTFTDFALYMSPSFGPTFGNGYDLSVTNNSHIMTNLAYSGSSYPIGANPAGSAAALTVLTGSSIYGASDVEVFVLSLDTQILRTGQKQTLLNWLNYNTAQGPWVQCWKSSPNMRNASLQFHQRCDFRGPTLTIMQTSHGYVIGGYSSVHFRSVNDNVPDANAFLFSFTSSNDNFGRRFVPWVGDLYTISDYANMGPSYGTLDLQVPDNFMNEDATSALGNSFDGMGATSVAGIGSFRVTEIEVFTMGNFSSATCFSVSASSVATCSGHGMCVGMDTCNCYPGFTGASCNVPICFGVPGSAVNSCSGRGTCTAVNRCSCRTGYSGVNCQFFVCYGVASFSSHACSRGGRCVDVNTCKCYPGFTGVQCELESCKFTDNLPTNSLILNSTERSLVASWVRSSNWTLCYRASFHGQTAQAFHVSCDRKGPTVSIFKSPNGNIYGGYASMSWRSINAWIDDPLAFTFVVRSHLSIPAHKLNRTSIYSYYDGQIYGPHFGDGDIPAVYSFLQTNISHTHYYSPSSFQSPHVLALPPQSQLFAGSSSFTPSDVEVFSTFPGEPMSQSTVLNDTYIELIQNWTRESNWRICYKSSWHGLSPQVFHARCDNKGKTVSVFRTTTGFIFGGYTSFPWTSSSAYMPDIDAFVFSLRNPRNYPPFIAPINDIFANQAIYDFPTDFPSFGRDRDVSAYSSLYPSSFIYPYGRTSFYSGFTATNYEEIEVFVVNPSLDESQILTTSSLQNTVNSLIAPLNLNDYKICYRASVHGYMSSAIHRYCGFKGEYLLFGITTTKYVFAASSQLQLNYTIAGTVLDPSARLYSINGPRGPMMFSPVTTPSVSQHINNPPSFGNPGFHDLFIPNSFDRTLSASRLGAVFRNQNLPNYAMSTFLAGSSSFTLSDAEVYTTTTSAFTLSSSTIASLSERDFITSITGRSASQWFACFRSAVSGFSSSAFHGSCDNRGASLVLYRVSSGNSFGGYTSVSWRSSGGNLADNNALIFTLSNPNGNMLVARTNNPSNSLYDHSSNLPSFGAGRDIIISGNTGTSSLETYEFITVDPWAALGGSRQFFIDDMEIFIKKDAELPPRTSFLNNQQKEALSSLVREPYSNLVLCYSSNTLGFDSNLFHEGCSGVQNTIIVAKTTRDTIVGGFSANGFVSNTIGFYVDMLSFLFTLPTSLQPNLNRINVPSNQFNYAVLNFPSMFGSIGSYSELYLPNYPNLLSSYSLQSRFAQYNQHSFMFFGGRTTGIAELEVFATTPSPISLATVSVLSPFISQIEAWTGRDRNQWFLCFRASRDTFNGVIFHRNCNNKGATISIGRNAASTLIFGGYTSVPWRSVNSYVSDSNAFIFSLRTAYNAPPMRSSQIIVTHAIYDHNTYLPTFGGGHDLIFNSGSARMEIGHSYFFPQFQQYNTSLFNMSGPYTEVEAYYVAPKPSPQGYLLSLLQRGALQNYIGLKSYSWSLCYQGSYHGFESGRFHMQCDFKGPTVTAVLARNVTFGAYASASFSPFTATIYDSSAFLYSFASNLNPNPAKYHHNSNQFSSIITRIDFGPTFGSAHDLYIASNSNNNSLSYARPGTTFSSLGLPQVAILGNAPSTSFTASEIEVYTLGAVPCASSCWGIPFSNPFVCSAHGSCVPPDTCLCQNGYTGEACQHAICFDVPGNESHVCSFRNGTCTAPDICTCNTGYTGTRCEIPICSGRHATNAAVCSSRGTCVRRDTCVCNNGFAGNDCQHFVCNGVSGGDSSVCSARGRCTNINTCTCNATYTGSWCEEAWCNNVSSLNSSVCSGHGVCALFDTCTCQRGYLGRYCEIPICYGVAGNAAGVCSGGKGICVARDTCQCLPNYFGSKCQTTSCFGTFSNSSSVCSNKGQCIAYDQCFCDAGFAGRICNETACYGVSYLSASVCSGRGSCIGIDNCNCSSPGFLGQNCEIDGCYGIAASDLNVCRGRGDCVSPNRCVCSSSWSGMDCNIPMCYGRNASDANVCSGHGSCTQPNTCVCGSNYSGQFCNITTCNSVANTNPSVCNGKGRCRLFNSCECQLYWSGTNCQTKLVVPECFGVNGEDPAVCNHMNGTCLSTNACQCSENYYGSSCSVSTCSGIFSNSSQVCSTNGTCAMYNKCICKQDFFGHNCELWNCNGINYNNSASCSSHGRCISPNTCACNAGWTGSNCEIPLCYGIPASSNNVCNSRNGTCLSPNNCICETGYTGTNCEIPICFGLTGSDNRVCSNSNGTCVRNNTCRCNSGYIGSTCQIPICFGRNATDTFACNNNGSCIRRDVCMCNVNYVGPECQIPVCYGLVSTNNSVCSSNGTCVRANTCICRPGYYGAMCEHYNCYGIHFSNASCSRNGICSAPNSCLCNLGYTGFDCSIPICFGINATDTRVCSFRNGTCNSPNSCLCNSGYSGSRCEIPICFDTLAINSSVCNNQNGTCIRNNTCSCVANYTGIQCEIPICFGVSATNNSVCSGKGLCTRANSCKCSAGYYGHNCQLYDCYNEVFHGPSVCSAHGICTRPQNCTCHSGWTGLNCNIPICYSIPNDSNSVCNNRNGTCLSPNTCLCNSGYYGNQCNLFNCSGIFFGNNSVCSSHGACVLPDQCICTQGYTGRNCEYPICFGIAANNNSVCNGRSSTCSAPDLCVCANGFTGAQCNIPVCFAKSALDPNVCSSNGTCTDRNTCVCALGYMGNQCEIPICYGLSANNSRTCSSNGTCISKDNCKCHLGYEGFLCETWRCSNHLRDHASSCSGNGVCVAPEKCFCNNGYTGVTCEIPICYGYDQNNSAVCSNRNGTCIAPNICSCNDGYAGNQCEIPICFGHLGNTTNVCNQRNGTCTAKNTCVCRAGYTGSTCSNPICFGMNSSDTNVCSGHGQCRGINTCICQSGYTGIDCGIPICYGKINITACNSNGTCTSPNTCLCNQGWTGVECEIPICFNRTQFNACSSRGLCLRNNTCVCNEGFAGLDCSLINCFSILSNSTSVCSSHGTCVSPDNCACNQGYVGSRCQYPVCSGIASNENSVCNKRGSCYSPNNCTCEHPFYGLNCEHYDCFGVNYAVACSQHGNCVSPNNCSCSTGYTGLSCSIGICFGKNGTRPDACSSHGLCYNHNNCSCDSGYTGDECEIPICFGKIATDITVCNNRNGSCVLHNVCSCNPGFYGNQCEKHDCFNISSSSSSVCSRNGVCVLPNQCRCNAGYYGNSCSTYNCYNHSYSSPLVCNAKNGTCISPDACVCNPDWIGATCNIPVCFGLVGNEACNSRGSCVRNNTCICQAGYTSANCSLALCNNKASNDAQVCSGHGTCTSPDSCRCATGYSGHDCQLRTCFGIAENDVFVCSGRGRCTDVNNCTCHNSALHHGEACEWQRESSEAVCFSKLASDAQVCSGNGTCVANDKCECRNGASGPNCEYTSCYGVAETHPRVCSSHGTCTRRDTCECASGYTGQICNEIACYSNQTHLSTCKHGRCVGPNQCMCFSGYGGLLCDVPMCFGVIATSNMTCSGRGLCVGPNVCECMNGTRGNNCQTVTCYGKLQRDRTVCNGHSCVAPNTCLCRSGYTGSQCEQPICYGIASSNPAVCSQQGTCVAPDMCNCIIPNKQSNCANCTPGFTGINCNTPICTSQICNNHGICNTNLNCTCYYDSERGYWAKPFCNTCANNYFGASCSNLCIKQTHCNGHGECIDNGICKCFSDDIRGHWQGSNCTTCRAGYFGSSCATSIVNFNFGDTGDRITAEFKFDKRNGRKQVPCAEVFSEVGMIKIGAGARCQWPNTYDEQFEVIFGADASVAIGELLQINMLPFSTNRTYQLVLVNAPNRAPIPVSVLKASPRIGVCDDIHLDGSFSFSTDRRPLSYSYRCISGYRIDALNMYLSNHRSAFVMIPSSLIEAGFEYVIELQVTNFFNQSSRPSNLTISKSTSLIPLVSIDGPKDQIVGQQTKEFTVSGIVQLQCRSTSSPIVTGWAQTSGIYVNFTVRQNTLIIPHFPFFNSPYTIQLLFSAHISSQPSLSAHITLNLRVVPQQIITIVREGNSRSIPFSSPIILDGSASYDPANSSSVASYEWMCLSKRTGGLCQIENAVTTNAVWELPSGTLPAGEYIFNFTFAKDSRVAQQSVEVTVLAQDELQHPIVSLSLSHRIIHRNTDKVEARGVAIVPNTRLSSSRFAYEWQIVDVTGDRVNVVQQVALSRINDYVMVFRPASFLEGHTIRVTLTVNYTNPNGAITQGFSAVSFVVVDAPFIGEFDVSPSIGVALQTDFTLTCKQFTTDRPPLLYSFGYMEAGKQIPLSFFSQSSTLVTKLPAAQNLTLYAIVKQGEGSVLGLVKVITVNARKHNSSEITAFLKQEAGELAQTNVTSERDTNELLTRANILLTMLNNDTIVQHLQPADNLESCPSHNQDCGHNCSNHGICTKGKCKCEFNFAGKFCQYTEEELNQKESLRHKLLLGVINAIETQFKDDEASFLQLALLCEKLTAIYEEVSQRSQLLVLNFFEKLVAKYAVDERIGELLIRTLSNIGQAMESSESDSTKLFSLFRTIEVLIKQLALKKFTGDIPYIVKTLAVSSLISKSVTNKIASQKFRVCSSTGNSSEIALPSLFNNLGSDSMINGVVIPEEVSLKLTVFSQNPYFWSNTSSNITSDVIRIDMMSTDGNMIALTELPEPITFTAPIRDASLFTRNMSKYQFVCKYWNTTLSAWRSNGCVVANISPSSNTVTCACNHTTDFSVFFDIIETIEMPILLIIQKSSANYVTVISVGVLYLIIILLFIFGCVLQVCKDRCCTSRGFTSVMAESCKKESNTQAATILFEQFTLLSLVFPFRIMFRTFSRIERAIVLLTGVSLMFALQSLHFTFTLDQHNWIASGITVSALSAIVYRFIGFVILYSMPRNVKITNLKNEYNVFVHKTKYKHEELDGSFDNDQSSSSQDSTPATPAYRGVIPKAPSSPKPLLTQSSVSLHSDSENEEEKPRYSKITLILLPLFFIFSLLVGIAISVSSVFALAVLPAVVTVTCTFSTCMLAWLLGAQLMYILYRIRNQKSSWTLDVITLIASIIGSVLFFVTASGSTVITILQLANLTQYLFMITYLLWLLFTLCISSVLSRIMLLIMTKKNKIESEDADTENSKVLPKWIAVSCIFACILITTASIVVTIYFGLHFENHKTVTWILSCVLMIGFDQIVCGFVHGLILLFLYPILK